MRNIRIENAIQEIKDLLQDESLDTEIREQLYWIMRDIENGVAELEDRIFDFESLWNRNPSFPDDYMGNWDDDDDDEEDKDDTV
jgi:hypothetical protein